MEIIELNNSTFAKIDLCLNIQDSLDEVPPALSFSLEWGTDLDKSLLLSRGNELGRQFLKLKTCASSEVLLLKEASSQKLCGWAGLNVLETKEYPEIFATYLTPGFRNYSLWLAMLQVRLQRALEMESEKVYMRVPYKYFDELTFGKVITPIFSVLIPDSVDPDFKDQCKVCDYFERECNQQNFLSIDVAKMLEHIRLRFGDLPFEFPLNFSLDLKKLRQPNRTTSIKAHWNKA